MQSNFDVYQWNKDGRPTSKAYGSDAYELRRHWLFAVNNYFMLNGNPTRLHIRGGGYVTVDSKYYRGKDWEWYQ
ncbi:head protein [Citrobacter phage Moon]|uniref:Uncharacterized protein n=1 Tax=Citrobacter phage Moon TaxID=1540095 RepID=A0A0A0YV88_9CAUD|nr:head protein [Citrobacter phage Moon]AIX12000.1 hypothetical protein CPT_Moon29 [Citrobacter phage Moon]